MIIVVLPSDDAESHAAESFDRFAEAIHGRVPDFTKTELHDVKAHARGAYVERRRVSPETHADDRTARSFCGEHWRVVPTKQNLCPKCGGSVMSKEERAEVRNKIAIGTRLGLYDQAEVERRREATLTRNAARKSVA